MLKRCLFALAIGASLFFGRVAHARETGPVGVVTSLAPDRLAIRTDSQEVVTVRLTPETAYLKWILAKPWQQDLRSNLRALHVGSRVHVDVKGSQPTAQTVWVVVGRPGVN